MKRYSTEADDPAFEFDTGEYVLYEEARLIEVDRDIKAANLQLLVEKVLAWETQDSAFQVAPEVQAHWDELMDIARSLKQ